MEKIFEGVPSKMGNYKQGSGSGITAISSQETLSTNVPIEDNCSVTNTLHGSNSHSEYQLSPHSTRSSWGFKPTAPIVILVIQLIMLIGLLSFVVWSSLTHQTVPRSTADLYLNYPQFTTTVITLIGTLLSLINTKLFSDAVRFAICVSLTNKGLSLYSLHAATSVASRSLLLDFDSRRICWAVVSIIYIVLSAIQISAWSSVITPRPVLVQSQGSFMDVDLAAPANNGSVVIMGFNDVSFQGFESGMAAVREAAVNSVQLLPYSNLVVNGTSRGILPIPDLVSYSSNWTRMEVLQQGLSANISCTTTSKLDASFSSSQTTGNLFNSTYHKITLSCDGTSNNSDPNPGDNVLNIVPDSIYTYIIFTVCDNNDTAKHDSTLFMQVSYDGSVYNMVCAVKPQVLNVNVTYENNGIVTIQSTTEIPNVIPTLDVMTIIGSHLPLTQSLVSNNVVNTLSNYLFYGPNETSDLSRYMAAYLRGVVEDGVTTVRQTMVTHKPSDADYSLVSTNVYGRAIVWGQLPQLRLMIIIAPVGIMITTIYITLLSLYRARHLCLKHNISFDPMNVLHIITACSSGNVQAIPFPDYREDIGAFCKDLDIEFPEGRDEFEDVQGFHFSEKE